MISAANKVCLLSNIRDIHDRQQYFTQVLVKQKERDDNIIRLASTMSDIFVFVHDAEPLKAIEAHVKTITLLIKQVTECGYFIAEYAKQKNFCQPPFASPWAPLMSVQGFEQQDTQSQISMQGLLITRTSSVNSRPDS